MIRSAASKVMWVGRATVFLVGLSVILALIFGVASMALGANGGNFILGQLNKATAITQLNGNVSGGPALQVANNKTEAGSRGLQVNVAENKPPIQVNATAGKATNLDADKLDGKNSTEIGVNGLQQREASSAENSDSSKSAQVFCPSDGFSAKGLVGTGFSISGGKSGTYPNELTNVVVTDVEFIESFFFPWPPGVRVTAYEEEPTSLEWRVTARAICAEGP